MRWSAVTIVCGWAVAASIQGEPGRVHLFPQVAVDGGSVTRFLLHNPNHEPITVQAELRGSSGQVKAARSVRLEPGAASRLEFGGSEGPAWGGWAKLSAERGFMVTEMINTGRLPWWGLSSVRPMSRFKVFGMVGLPDLQTGVALANPSLSKSSRVKVTLRAGDGGLIREASFELPPGAHRSG